MPLVSWNWRVGLNQIAQHNKYPKLFSAVEESCQKSEATKTCFTRFFFFYKFAGYILFSLTMCLCVCVCVCSVYLTTLSMVKIIELGCRRIITASLMEWHWRRKPSYSEEKNCPSANLFSTNSTKTGFGSNTVHNGDITSTNQTHRFLLLSIHATYIKLSVVHDSDVGSSKDRNVVHEAILLQH